MNTQKHHHPALLMLNATVLWSAVPLMVAAAAASQNPYGFQIILIFGTAITRSGYLFLKHRNLLTNRSVWNTLQQTLRTKEGFYATLTGTHFVLFAAATAFLDTALVTVIVGGTQIVFVALRKRSAKNRVYQQTRNGTGWLMGLAFCGAGFAILSQSGGTFEVSSLLTTMIGVALAVSATVVGACSSYGLAVGELISNQVTNGTQEQNELGGTVLTNLAAGLFWSVLLLPVAVLTATKQTSNLWAFGFSPTQTLTAAGAGVLVAAGAALFVKANLRTNDLGVNTIGFGQPALAIILLTHTGFVTVARPDLLILGMAAIIVTNALLTAKPKPRTPLLTRQEPTIGQLNWTVPFAEPLTELASPVPTGPQIAHTTTGHTPNYPTRP